MARKIGLIFLGMGTVCFASIIVFQLYHSGFNISSLDGRLIGSFLAGIIAIGKIFTGQPQHSRSISEVEKEYEDELKNVFSYDPKARKKLLKAIILCEQNKYRSAIKKLNTLLKACHTNNEISTVHFFIAVCYDQQEMWTQALEHYLNVVSHNPANDIAFSNAGRLYQAMGNIDEALDCYKKAIAISSDNAITYTNMADLYLEIMEIDKAIEAANEALRTRPNLYQAMNKLALAYSLKNDKQSAEKYFQQSVINGCPNADDIREMMKQMTDGYREMECY